MEDFLDADILREGLRSRILGQNIHYLPECGSTNQIARAMAENGAPDGTLVVTDYQTAGRGRLGRDWIAPRGTSILLSLVLRPSVPLARMAQIGMAVGLGCVEGIRRETSLEARLKWPNDFFVSGRKVGGMLSDAQIDGEAIRFLIVGIGVNVNFDPANMKGIPPYAASLSVGARKSLLRGPIIRRILAAVEPHYLAVCQGASLHAQWAHMSDTPGSAVRVTMPDGIYEGLAESVEEDGALLVRLSNGTKKRVVVGDVIAVRAGENADPGRKSHP
jgi:BirA family transcriptional regulator, biotin operon repressor / biotin---[acetyl-CoA-carboxylase] ligase